MIVCGVVVPDAPHPAGEICHAFVYRWLIASQRITGTHWHPDAVSFHTPAVAQIWRGQLGQHATPARRHGTFFSMPGEIIGFWENGGLLHSMVADTSTVWAGANNGGTFGGDGGRRMITMNSTVYTSPAADAPGWLGDGNRWRRSDGVVVEVTTTIFGIEQGDDPGPDIGAHTKLGPVGKGPSGFRPRWLGWRG